MFHTHPRPMAALLAVLSLTLVPVQAQDASPQTLKAQSAVQPQAPTRAVDAQETRQALLEVLKKHPPSVTRVLSADPSLMRNDVYLAPYPELRTFLAQHPEVPQNAAYYLAITSDYWNGQTRPAQSQQLRMIESFLGGAAALVVMAVVLGTLVWLIRTVLDQRRWNRLSKIQAEVHSKLMDRFSSNDELMTYVQTPSGRRFLESGPSPLPETPVSRNLAAPFSRILWSVQAGVVLGISGLGALFLSGRLVEEASQFFFGIGVLMLALGAGFVVSAAASFVLSRKLGLIEPPAADHG